MGTFFALFLELTEIASSYFFKLRLVIIQAQLSV